MSIESVPSVLPIKLFKKDKLFGYGSSVVAKQNKLYTSLHVLLNIDQTTPKLLLNKKLHDLNISRYFNFEERSCYIELPNELHNVTFQSEIASKKPKNNNGVYMIGYYNNNLYRPRVFVAKIISSHFNTFYLELDKNRNYSGLSGGGIFDNESKLVGIINGSVFGKNIECEFITPDRYER